VSDDYLLGHEADNDYYTSILLNHFRNDWENYYNQPIDIITNKELFM